MIYKFKGRQKVYLEYILSDTRTDGTQVDNILKYLLMECQPIHYVQGIYFKRVQNDLA